MTDQNGCQKTHTRNSNQSVIRKITKQNKKWPPQKLIKLRQLLLLIEKSQFMPSFAFIKNDPSDLKRAAEHPFFNNHLKKHDG